VSGSNARYRVRPQRTVGGELRVPGDKSISHRAMMLGGIADGVTEVEGFLASADCLSTLNAMRAMGVSIETPGAGRVRLAGAGLRGLKAAQAALDMGNAGTAMRLSMGLLAGQAFDSTLVGDASLSRRPMERVARPLRTIGARIETTDGHAPVNVLGGAALAGAEHVLEVASAQVKSALLLAGLYAEGPTSVTEPAPTRDHTERMLAAFGVPVQVAGRRVTVSPVERLEACRIEVPGDISSAAFFLVAGALAARQGLLIRRVGLNPTRTGVIEILRLMGADIRVHPAGQVGREPVADLEVHASELTGIHIPEELVPLAIDEFPVLFIAAVAAKGETVLTGAAELRVKESDRIAVMAEGLNRLGVETEVYPDGMRVRGGTLGGGTVDSHGDHRIAMSFAVAALRAEGELVIEDVANVGTSFPDFPGVARGIGLEVTAET
jgi:3-phosphoshikimate 1-carboxyvinyltransferase